LPQWLKAEKPKLCAKLLRTYRVDPELFGAVGECRIFSADCAATSETADVEFPATVSVARKVAAGFPVLLRRLAAVWSNGARRHELPQSSSACQSRRREFLELLTPRQRPRHGFHFHSLADRQRSEKIRPTAAAAAATNQLSSSSVTHA